MSRSSLSSASRLASNARVFSVRDVLKVKDLIWLPTQDSNLRSFGQQLLRASRDAAAQQVQGHLYGEGTDALAIAEELPV